MKSKKPHCTKPSYEERQRVCGNKVSYGTVSEVRAYIREAGSRIPLGYYRCPICRAFHVTSSPE